MAEKSKSLCKKLHRKSKSYSVVFLSLLTESFLFPRFEIAYFHYQLNQFEKIRIVCGYKITCCLESIFLLNTNNN